MKPDVFDSIVIVGAGHAGVIAAESLRREGYQGRIVLIGGECHVPYERPPLSKQLLAADPTVDRTTLKPESFYAHAFEDHPSLVAVCRRKSELLVEPSGLREVARRQIRRC